MYICPSYIRGRTSKPAFRQETHSDRRRRHSTTHVELEMLSMKKTIERRRSTLEIDLKTEVASLAQIIKFRSREYWCTEVRSDIWHINLALGILNIGTGKIIEFG